MSSADLRNIKKQVQDKRQKDRRKSSHDAAEEESDESSELSWKEKLLDSVLAIKPDAFERLCQRLLRESGFAKVEITGRSGDGGIDGVGVLRLNPLSFHVLFQCKRWKGSVGAAV